jgi:hypothetical protein
MYSIILRALVLPPPKIIPLGGTAGVTLSLALLALLVPDALAASQMKELIPF